MKRKHPKCPYCYQDTSRSGKRFTLETLEQHKRDCSSNPENEIRFPLTDLVADDDMPDGAYFAMA